MGFSKKIKKLQFMSLKINFNLKVDVCVIFKKNIALVQYNSHALQLTHCVYNFEKQKNNQVMIN